MRVTRFEWRSASHLAVEWHFIRAGVWSSIIVSLMSTIWFTTKDNKILLKKKKKKNIEEEDEDTNISSNGGDTLSPMPHGNQNTHSPMMVTHYNNTNFNITFDRSSLLTLYIPCSPLTHSNETPLTYSNNKTSFTGIYLTALTFLPKNIASST